MVCLVFAFVRLVQLVITSQQSYQCFFLWDFSNWSLYFQHLHFGPHSLARHLFFDHSWSKSTLMSHHHCDIPLKRITHLDVSMALLIYLNLMDSNNLMKEMMVQLQYHQILVYDSKLTFSMTKVCFQSI